MLWERVHPSRQRYHLRQQVFLLIILLLRAVAAPSHRVVAVVVVRVGIVTQLLARLLAAVARRNLFWLFRQVLRLPLLSEAEARQERQAMIRFLVPLHPLVAVWVMRVRVAQAEAGTATAVVLAVRYPPRHRVTLEARVVVLAPTRLARAGVQARLVASVFLALEVAPEALVFRQASRAPPSPVEVEVLVAGVVVAAPR